MGDRWRASTEMTSCAWLSSPRTSRRDCSRVIRTVRDATPVGLCAALCQGAALHYLDEKNGVKDFGVWSFYAARDDGPFPYRWRGTADYGPSKFGRYPGDPPSFTGRRVDLLGRSLDVPLDAESATVLRDYFSAARTRSAKELAAKAVVLINPGQLAGKVVWPVASHAE